ncbi:GCN5-related N-acetyltransferase [Amycolatopsis mediterranei S699]|uniref:GCN5-related N-acetyltransferase n=1 Tax=Amycolatopsis mediterranei (strain U-32) TaxID=749927 RepID=A0A0H3DAN5_AMYMU|nr:GNAT family N-acetyltransferase [Amycolatopsis mediterranei]ADJ47148.1 GCN5-related N-acetyltransferase [Amycolatopsis mediterranei U32]AFO78859.1 GCN5-related N-acetyltransferase [Amycolatopsis mediterranei S699]AGT85987.1 GCN5-related N-acetyltransferase [Amycolatopsis mediterranei RB]KDO04505.1 GCN5 family acetyltransferase [Amycolatopsis mediterranei]KDU85519.1 GCN5 family acetyltransferase [Amycolatopsis mediterranei]
MTITPRTLRVAGPDDLAAVLPLAVEFYAEDGFATGEHALRRNLTALLASPAARVAVVHSPDRLLGFAVTTTSFGLENGLIAELEGLFVLPAARRRGLAGRLIEDSVAWAREQGCRHLELVIAPNGRDAGHLVDYYLAHGFRDDGRRLLSRSL